MSYRSPLARVRGLGAAKDGTAHFWLQRLTAVSNLVLVCILVGLLASLANADYATVKRTLAEPHFALLILLVVLSVATHMRLGMQTIIEDYVHGEGRKLALLMLNTFFAIVVAAVSVYAVLKVSFGA
jgi:succinate dehydrogenase / fumarate reductase membrane anchor subunit